MRITFHGGLLLAAISASAQAIKLNEDEVPVTADEVEPEYDVNLGMDLAASATKKVKAFTSCWIEWKKADTTYRQDLKHGRDSEANLGLAYEKVLECTAMQYGWEGMEEAEFDVEEEGL